MPTVNESLHTAFAQKRVSWGAIFAGVAVALVMHILLGVLGVAVGATVVDPAQDADPMSGLGIGAGIFFVVSALIALFSGGYTAGALAIIQDRTDRTLHGLTTWAVVTILSFVMISSAIGGIIGGTASMIAGGAQTAAETDDMPVDRIMEELRARGIDPQQELQEQRQQLEQTDPAEAERVAREAGQTAADNIAAAAWWTFLILLLSAIAAAVGANVGANRPVVVREQDRLDATPNNRL